MPTYDYACEACGHRFEHFQTMTSRRLRKCPECARPKLMRLVGSGAGLIFKGSGFYETDYKRAGQKPPSETVSDAPAKKDAKPESTDGGASKGDTSKSPSKSDGGGDDAS